jgi:hypothetical protein
VAFWAPARRGPKPYRPVRRNSKARPVTQVLTENPADRIQFDRRGEKIPSHTASPANRNETTSAIHHKNSATLCTNLGVGVKWVFGRIGITSAFEIVACDYLRARQPGMALCSNAFRMMDAAATP